MPVSTRHKLLRAELISDRVFDPPDDTIARPRGGAASMGKRNKDQTFGFDRVFDENATSDDVYQATTRSLIDSVLDGYNATVFAYGATGCGKTHTITGTFAQPGIIWMTMQDLFDKVAERADEKHTEISLSYLEIYNETIKDLLQPSTAGGKQGLMLREDANQAVSVAGLSTHKPKDVGEVMAMITTGNAFRTVSPTEANATSSRSHAVLQINVAQKDRNADVNEPHTMATLSIIDLAGSERASVTKNRGDRLLEGANINKSLLALGSCINALCDTRKNNHIPYRNSKLTRLLKFSLGGNCKTVMIVCVSPSSAHFDETQNTLRYANRAKNIQTKVTRNVYNVNRHVKDFLIKIDEQMALINELRAQQKNSEGAAFVKFKKQSDKREGIARDGITSIRRAFDVSLQERKEKVNSMKMLRQIEKRIFLLNSWIVAFDSVCENRDEGDMPESLQTMRKTANGILVEFENSRHHLHQRIQKNTWERAMDSALQSSVTRLTEADGSSEGTEVASLEREVELIKSNFARDALTEVMAVEKEGDGGVTQVLLAAQIDIISSLGDVLAMTAADAAVHAKLVLQRLFTTATKSAGHVVKPDGSLKITEKFPPMKKGTPKKQKMANVNPFVDEDVQLAAVPQVAPIPMSMPPRVLGSPMKASPRRKKIVVGKKLGVSFTPNKKSPKKRSVKWRDDADAGALAEYEKTPVRFEDTPETASNDSTMILPPVASSSLSNGDVFTDININGSSPIPQAPQASYNAPPKAVGNRFQAGFLAKKADNGSPNSSSMNNSFEDNSPLRQIDPSMATNRRSIERDGTPEQSANNSAHGIDENISATDTAKIRAALRRSRGSSGGPTELAIRAARRRSPTAATRHGSPPGDPMFTAGQARRMIKSEREHVAGVSVLSPRAQAVSKTAAAPPRRATVATGAMSAIQAIRMKQQQQGGVAQQAENQRPGRTSAEGVNGGTSKWR